jgi:prepilin peptidase CpaA
MTAFHTAPLVAGVLVSLLGLAWAAASDILRYEIPNRVCGLALGAAVLLVGLALFAKGWLGGGDVKLLAVVTPWAGLSHLTDFTVVTAFAGVAVAAVLMSPLKRRLPAPPEGVAQDFRRPMPFGAPLAAGGAWVALLHLSSLR